MIKHFGLVLITLCMPPSAFADGLLKHDPFARPLLSAPLPVNTTTGAVTEEETPWNPQLIALMVSGENSLVNLDGVILKVGEEKDGYRFVQARDHEAVFKKGNKRVVLNMNMPALHKNEGRGGI